MLRIIKTVFNTFVDWGNILNKPSTFTPSSHTQDISTINNLQNTLDSKVNTSEYDSKINQNVRTTASPSFAGLTVGASSGWGKIHVINQTACSSTAVFEGYVDSGSAVGFTGYKGRGSYTSKVAVNQYDKLLEFAGYAYNGGSSPNYSMAGNFCLMAESAPTANGAYIAGSWHFYISPSNTAAPVDSFLISAYRAAVNGHISGSTFSVTNVSGRESYRNIGLKAVASQTGDYLTAFASDGSTVKANLDINGMFKASGYKSSDGSVGATGSFTSADGKTVTVKNGLITNIV